MNDNENEKKLDPTCMFFLSLEGEQHVRFVDVSKFQQDSVSE